MKSSVPVERLDKAMRRWTATVGLLMAVGWCEPASAVFAASSTSASPTAAPPDRWQGRETVMWEEVVQALDDAAFELEQSEAVRQDYANFVRRHGLADTDALFADYVRAALAFEATRDGGWWHLRWTITNRAPRSDEVWKQWEHFELPTDGEVGASADAECDELSALFAVVARDLGVDGIGLFWPVWNHVVAVWTIEQPRREPVRIVVPTSQIMLGRAESLGTDGFDPGKQKTIYTYRRNDIRPKDRVPATLARFMLAQVQRYAGRPAAVLQRERNARSDRFGGS